MPETAAKSYLPELLNRVEAILDSGFATVREFGVYLLPDQEPRQSTSRVAEWIRSRVKSPNGETALRMQAWAAEKTLEIDAAGEASKKKYRTAFKAVQARRKQP